MNIFRLIGVHEFFSFNFPLREYFPISFLMVLPLSGNIVPGCLWIVLSVPRTRLIVLFPEVVDRQISGLPWRSCHKNIAYKHENAL